VFALLRGSDSRDWGYHSSRGYERVANPAVLSAETAPLVLPVLAATGRCVVRKSRGAEGVPAAMRSRPPWKAAIELARDERGGGCSTGLWNGTGVAASGDVDLLLASGLFFHAGTAYQLDAASAVPLVADIREHGPIAAPGDDGALLAAEVQERAWGPSSVTRRASLRGDRRTTDSRVAARAPAWGVDVQNLSGQLTFRYGGTELGSADPRPSILDAARRAVPPPGRGGRGEGAGDDDGLGCGFANRETSPASG
jgi:hypothetical protein